VKETDVEMFSSSLDNKKWFWNIILSDCICTSLESRRLDGFYLYSLFNSSYSRRRKGRPRMSRIDDVESDLKKMKVKGWKEKMRDREQCRLVVEEAKDHPGAVVPSGSGGIQQFLFKKKERKTQDEMARRYWE
jgi:hypothetical protein